MTKCSVMLCNRTMRDKRRAVTTGGHVCNNDSMAFYSLGDDHTRTKLTSTQTQTRARARTHTQSQLDKLHVNGPNAMVSNRFPIIPLLSKI